MARQPKSGFSVYPKRGWFYVYFTWRGEEHRYALRTRDRREAEEAAARRHAAVVNGVLRPRQRVFADLAQLLGEWIESKRTSVDPDSIGMLETYARRYVFVFGELGAITEATATDFGRRRLGQAMRKTVLRELSYLREFLAWCRLHGYLVSVPVVPGLPKKARGTRTGTHRQHAVVVTEEEAAAIIALLPETSKTIDGRRWPIRARFAFMWETALRPETIARLSTPGSWRPGMSHITLEDEDDKARFGRELDVTPEAIAILEAVSPETGLVFGRHEFSKRIKRAALTVLGEARGRDFAPYDFRHARARERLDAGATIRGVGYMLGHKKASTTDIYTAPDRRAGRDAIRTGYKNEGTGSEGNWGDRRGLNPRQPEPQSDSIPSITYTYYESASDSDLTNTTRYAPVRTGYRWVIRQGPGQYLSPEGSWGPLDSARRCRTEAEARTFAAIELLDGGRHGVPFLLGRTPAWVHEATANLLERLACG